MARRPEELLVVVAAEHGGGIVASEVASDHVHRFVRVRPADSPAHVARLLKARSSRVRRQELAWLCHRRGLWSTSYVAASEGDGAETTVTRYTQHQWDGEK